VDHQQVNERWVPLLCQDPATAPHEAGALVIDDTGDADALGAWCPMGLPDGVGPWRLSKVWVACGSAG
jgi:hypothetical protein